MIIRIRKCFKLLEVTAPRLVFGAKLGSVSFIKIFLNSLRISLNICLNIMFSNSSNGAGAQVLTTLVTGNLFCKGIASNEHLFSYYVYFLQ